MTEETQTVIDDAPEMDANNDAPETQEVEEVQASEPDANDTDDNEGGDVEFPKKAVNALNRKDKKINKLNAKLRELEAKLNEAPKQAEQKDINPDDFENYGDYLSAQVDALVEQRMSQSQSDMQKQQLTEQQTQIKEARDMHIVEQAQEAAKVFTDLPQVWQQNAAILDALPESIADIFYSIDNAPAAVYTLAKEGKLQDLAYKNPALAAYEIVNAQNKGLDMLSKPQTRVSQAPAPMDKTKGTAKASKSVTQLSGKELLDRFAK